MLRSPEPTSLRHTVSLAQAQAMEDGGARPKGYVDQLKDMALRQNGDDLILSGESYVALKAFYAPKTHKKPVKRDLDLPGDRMEAFIQEWSGVKSTRNCSCHAFRRQMNQWGWHGCWQNRFTIWSYLLGQAKERKMSIAPMAWSHRKQVIGVFKEHLPEVGLIDVIGFLGSIAKDATLGAKDGQQNMDRRGANRHATR